MITTDQKGHSASVEICLRVGGKSLSVAQVQEFSLILRDKCDIPAGTRAEVVINVDGEDSVYPILLHRGISSQSELVEFL